jgi:RHS repeat-associated protein
VIQTVESGPARPYALSSYAPDTATISALVRTDSSGYDAAGNLTYKRSRSTPWSDAEITDRLAYDAAGRLRKRDIGSGPDSMVYDPAGNMISMLSRSGLWVTQSYDALNRLVQRVVPERKYASQRCTGYSPGPISGPGNLCLMIFPYYPNAGDSLKIVADTARFVYDTLGNMTQASNRYARVRRTYYRGGALKTDTTAIGRLSAPLTDSVTRGQQYVFDLSGKRSSMQWFLGTNGYSYNDFGALSTVTDPNSNQYGIRYTLAGQVDSLLLGTGVTEDRNYDSDGRLTYRNRVSTYAPLGGLVSGTLTYDRMNRVIHSVENSHGQITEDTRIAYDGLGAVLANEQTSGFGANVEEFRNDPLGNVLYRKTRRTAGTNDAPFTFQYSPLGELMTSFSHLSNPPGQNERADTLKQTFLSQQLIRENQIVQNPNDGSVSLELATRHYNGADDKLMVVQRYSWRGPSLSDGTWEEYWYDALGRRVLTRARRDPSSIYDATISGPLCMGGIQCRSFTERVWWDGDQALVEERTSEGTSDVSNSGLVANIHGLTLDEPLAVMSDQTRIINYNWRGQGESSVFPNGQAGDASLGNTATEIDWPALTQAQTYFTPGPGSGGGSNPKRWMGTFVANGQGTTGMLYRRNRYFSPVGGQFTQADPIGIAGGMNAFGFAGGDPVNFSDPFGLCPDKNDPKCDNYGGPVKFVGVQGTAILGTGVAGAAGVFTSEAGFGPYLRFGGGFGGDVAAGGEIGVSQSLNSFRRGAYGACLGGGVVSGCFSANSAGKTVTGNLSIGSRDIPLPISMHVERSYTFAPTTRDISAAVQLSLDNAIAQLRQFKREAYWAMTRIP